MNILDFLLEVGHPTVFHVGIAKKLGSNNACLFLEQLIYWTGKERGKDSPNDGWIFKSSEQIFEELNITYKEQTAIRELLKGCGILKEDYKRLEHKLFFKIDIEGLQKWWNSNINKPNPDNTPGYPEMTKSNLGNIQNDSSKINKNVTNTPESALNLGISRNDKKSDGELTKSKIVYTENTYRDYNKEEEEKNFSLKKVYQPSETLEKEIKLLYGCSDKAFQTALDEFKKYYAKNSPVDWNQAFEIWCRKRNIWEYNEKAPVTPQKEDKSTEKMLAERPQEERGIMLRLLNEFGEPIFKSWLLHLKLLESTNELLRFKVPSNFIKEWIETNYLEDIMRILNRRVEIEVIADNLKSV